MPQENDKKIINCHTHVFTIDHVPNEFGKSLLPWPFYKLISIRIVKWYYKNLTQHGNRNLKRLNYRLKNIGYFIAKLLKLTYILWWIYLIIRAIVKWLFRILLNFLNLELIIDPEVKALIDRFRIMARYSISYKSQQSIFNFLKKNYPPNSEFITLSMDMEYMNAGKPKISYLSQIEELELLKEKNKGLRPFIFLDPRRIKETKGLKGFNDYSEYVKDKMTNKKFDGFKMYPALGYFPFDKNLIDLYEFAIENDIPIMTHCIRGTVYFRGNKKKEWNKHPILKYNKKGGNLENVPLPQTKNSHFSSNFTHPLNYHCLLDKNLLSEYLGEEKDLSKLKICLAHFGGTEEWEKYRNDAWNNYNNNISPGTLEEYSQRKNTLNHKSRRTIWWNASWLSVIYDLMVKYENVYSDVSFILFNEELFPMLKYLLHDQKVRDKILFGTDFYVVSQKGIDKELYQNLRSYLGEELFLKIANENAKRYLQNKFTR